MTTAPGTLVIFDCDGVLVDSELISFDVLNGMLAAAGAPVPKERAFRDFLGKSIASVTTMVAEEYAIAITDSHLASMRQTLFARFRAELQPISGLLALLPQLGHRYCVASSSQIERIRLSLEITGLLGYFDPHIFSASMVEHGKPAPDLFLHAAAKMGYLPEQCVVVEDSPAGIAAARAAGMRVFAFTGGAHAAACDLPERARALKPDAIFDDMGALAGLLAAEH